MDKEQAEQVEQIRQRWAKMPEGPYHFSYMRIVAPKSEVASEQDPKLRPGVWSWERFHAETLANAQQDVHDLLAALDVAEAKAEQRRKALMLYVEEFAGIHDEECPQDDTCTCERVRFAEEALKEGK